MKFYVVVLTGNSKPEMNAYTSMKAASEELGVSYETVRRCFKDGYHGKLGSIYAVEVNKIKGRGGSRMVPNDN